MARRPPSYPTREQLAAGAAPVAAVPKSRLLGWMTGNAGHALDRWAVRWTGYSFISWQAARLRGIAYQHSLLLTTTGRRTGRRRSVVLPYVRDGDSYVVVGSNAGGPRNPAWVENLRADPACEIIVGRRRRPAVARIADGDERDRLLTVVAARRPQVFNYDEHARGHGRRLELVALR